MKSVIVDTSSILFGLSKGFDTFQRLKEEFPACRICIPSGVIRELRKFAKGKKKESKYANVALALLKKHNIVIVRGNEYVDTWIVKHAAKYAIVCTNDLALKRRLKSRNLMAVSILMNGSFR
ncbi:MAG: hypothetical protein KGH49_02210 [Candidatus Micrarchaeota archaeon]|nr:hypothetical protein [Candidatus Micrarchaeota archaeon]